MNDSPPLKNLETASAVIDALGGTAVVARLLAAAPAAVSHWRRRDQVPPKYFLLVSAELAAIGAEAPPTLFGIDASHSQSVGV